MIRNFLSVAARNILKYKLFSAINIIGLALGLTSAFLILLFVIDEYATNSWVENVDQQYFIESDWKTEVGRLEITTLAPLARNLKEEYPHLAKNYFRIHAVSANVSDGKGKNFRLGLQIGDSTFVNMFGIPLLHGSPEKCLSDPNSILITADVARKFFGRTDVIGEVLNFKTENPSFNAKGNKDYIISGVIRDLPQNSITDNIGPRTDVYMNQHNIANYGPVGMFDNWNVDIIQSRIELMEGVTPDQLIEPMQQLVAQNAPDYIKEDLIPKLTPLKSYNLTDNDNAKRRLLIILCIAAAFILGMAILNFVNISLGTSLKRLKEIGVRKVIGGLRGELVLQFLLESILFALLGSFLALGIVQLVLPSFGSLLDKPYLFSNVEPWPIVAAFFTIGLLSGILAGIYPAAILSKKKIIYALKGKPPRGKGQRLRKVLLIGQFVIAIFFLVCTAIVSEQISYFLNKDIGYNGDNVLIISSLPRTYSNAGVAKMIDLKNRFLSHPSVDKAALSYEIPDGRRGQDTEIKPVGKEEYLYFPLISTDEQYFATYDIPIIEGRRYRDDDYSKNRILLNETAARELFGEESAIGKQVNLRNRPDQEVIGIVSDFNFGSLHTAIQGIVFMHTLDVNLYRYYSFKLKPDDINQTVDELTAIWREVFPKAPFVYFFMDDKLDELYKAEDQFKRTLFIASIFALGIVLIGLFGTTLQSLSERTKEIGVRKTLGASISNLWLMLLKSYAIILIISSIIAFPLAYFAMDKWLQNYAYRISQSPAIYIVGFGLILLLTLLTIGYQIWKASRANPVDSLRYE